MLLIIAETVSGYCQLDFSPVKQPLKIALLPAAVGEDRGMPITNWLLLDLPNGGTADKVAPIANRKG